MQNTLWFEQESVHIPILWKPSRQCRHIKLRLQPPGVVEVVYPPATTAHRLKQTLDQARSWIMTHYRQYQQQFKITR